MEVKQEEGKGVGGMDGVKWKLERVFKEKKYVWTTNSVCYSVGGFLIVMTAVRLRV